MSLLGAVRSQDICLTLDCTIGNIRKGIFEGVICVLGRHLHRSWFYSGLVSGVGLGSKILMEQVKL